MKVDFKWGEYTEGLSYPGLFFIADLRCRNADGSGGAIINICGDEDLFKTLFGEAKCFRTERRLPDGGSITVGCYSSDDPAIAGIMQNFGGLKILEFSQDDIEVTVTV